MTWFAEWFIRTDLLRLEYSKYWYIFVLFIAISIHLKTLNIICPQGSRLFSGNPRGSGPSAASEPGPGESRRWCGSHELGPGPPLLALAWSCQWPTRGGALHPPRPSHCEGEKRGGAGASVSQIVPQIFSAGTADGFLLFLLRFFHKTNQKGFQSVTNPSHNQSRRNNKNFSKQS